MNDYRRQIVMDICNSFLVQDVHVRRTSTNILEAIESGTGFIRGAIILKGMATRPPTLFAHSRKNIDPSAFEKDMANIASLLAQNGNNGVVKHTLVSGEVKLIDDISEYDDYIAADLRVRSELCIPIVNRGTTIGALNIESTKVSAFGRGDVTLLNTIATQLGLLFGSRQSENEIYSDMTISDIAAQITSDFHIPD